MIKVWKPINTAPLNKTIEILPLFRNSFIGDVWDCSNRRDINHNKLIRLTCFDGHIAVQEVDENMLWCPLDNPIIKGDMSDADSS